MGSFSASAMARISPAPPAGLRIVAKTVCPPRARVTAVASPMPVLVPVINAIATKPSFSRPAHRVCVIPYGWFPRS